VSIERSEGGMTRNPGLLFHGKTFCAFARDASPRRYAVHASLAGQPRLRVAAFGVYASPCLAAVQPGPFRYASCSAHGPAQTSCLGARHRVARPCPVVRRSAAHPASRRKPVVCHPWQIPLGACASPLFCTLRPTILGSVSILAVPGDYRGEASSRTPIQVVPAG
jgi:hypothetical protein